MTSNTQDTVSSILGASELLQQSNILLAKKQTSVIFIENGFQIHTSDLPYYFQINYDIDFGWVVFLTSVHGGCSDDQETDKFYHQLEDIIDMINEKYFGEDDITETSPFRAVN